MPASSIDTGKPKTTDKKHHKKLLETKKQDRRNLEINIMFTSSIGEISQEVNQKDKIFF